MNGIQWGWRVTCMHAKCTRTVDQWGGKGVPALPWSGVYISGPLAGWFIYHCGGRAREDYKKGHVSFCPEHAHIGTEWLAQITRWEGEKAKIGRSVHMSLVDRIAEYFSPADPRLRGHNRAIGKVVDAWTQENPRPRPPWRT